MSLGDLRVSLLQGDTRWRDPAGNRAMYEALARPLAGRTDLLILPETFTSGFSNEAVAQAETMEGPSVSWLRQLSREIGAAVTGSIQIRDGDKVYNRLLWADPEGGLAYYDKRHLFRMANEHERYAGGTQRLIVSYKGWRICPQVCYDLRFPVFLRNRFGHSLADRFDYDLLLFVANWPAVRRHAWRTLLRARAIENLCAVAAVNRVGTDGNGIAYAGDSALIDALGESLVECGAVPQVACAILDGAALEAHRARFPAHLDADDFTLDLGT